MSIPFAPRPKSTATLAGQSGSPIVDAKGRAVALVSIGSEQVDLSSGTRTNVDAGPQPILKLQLPPWVLKTMRGMPHR
jgi:hypothetical protein